MDGREEKLARFLGMATSLAGRAHLGAMAGPRVPGMNISGLGVVGTITRRIASIPAMMMQSMASTIESIYSGMLGIATGMMGGLSPFGMAGRMQSSPYPFRPIQALGRRVARPSTPRITRREKKRKQTKVREPVRERKPLDLPEIAITTSNAISAATTGISIPRQVASAATAASVSPPNLPRLQTPQPAPQVVRPAQSEPSQSQEPGWRYWDTPFDFTHPLV